MDIGTHLTEFGPIDTMDLREAIARQGQDFWSLDRLARKKLAGKRSGDAIYYYNDQPAFVRTPSLDELTSTGSIGVLRNISRPLFDRVDAIVTARILPLFGDCDVLRVQLAELAPGETIDPHDDLGILTRIHRLHVPIVTNDAVRFVIGGEEYSLKQGVLYELNNAVVHSVHNDGECARIHLLVDMLPHSLGRARYFDDEGAMFGSVVRRLRQQAAAKPGA